MSRIIVRCYHIISLHIGPQPTSSLISNRYCILSGRSASRYVIFKYLICAKYKTVTPSTLTHRPAGLPNHACFLTRCWFYKPNVNLLKMDEVVLDLIKNQFWLHYMILSPIVYIPGKYFRCCGTRKSRWIFTTILEWTT